MSETGNVMKKGRAKVSKKKEYKTKLPVGEIISCPEGHKDTYICMEEAIIKEHGFLLGCNVCEDFFELTPQTSSNA